ncbi:conserved hypothetical protein [Pyrenophora tritici-repentis Pt-1C-BFP]|uniref:25S rRNA (uridine-N(3))-methyltransferase BMT5-like domain-containing protein n=1 Tax=Pyrenophora tritici-repentis (strain Pt-1C-BFP) TaxID=426418 RepID=B2VVP4_PYRTR|nr:uncharacterized protein PTRG_01256 [Pyrenophora tritici-repentis Pt-1C-BFP]EDU40694.1 conserved hypothetical protein [Pyrenophora tritici-repentis Pt-1C-BFP]
MSKTKTKRARRELKREGDRKIMAHHRKIAKAAETKPTTTATAKATATTAKHKSKKQKTSHQTITSTTSTATTPTQTQTQTHHQPSQQPPIPFSPYDHILLVGEGDFSFTHSLAVAHGCANVVGTCYDSLEEVRAKYPRFEDIREELEALTPPVPLHYGIDATRISGYKGLRCRRDDDFGVDDEDEEEGGEDEESEGGGRNGKAGNGSGRRGKRQGYDTIVFQFPHTGGLSTDQNRQVRANQHLLVSFFNSCLETPTPKHRIAQLLAQSQKLPPSKPPFLRPHGKIIVTLFESDPYTLWNIRDLARHVGLKVVTSFAFDASQYPGYAHVRTLGAMETGWKGEDRRARMRRRR